jgi:hypothetical protein
MKRKKTLPSAHSHNATKFVASEPLEVVVRELGNSPRIELELLKSHPNHCDYRVTFNDDSKSIPIFVTMQRWNKNETLVTLNYYQSSRLLALPIIVLLILAVFFVIGLALNNADLWSTSLLIIVGIGMLAIAIHNRQNGLGNNLSSSVDFMPEQKRLQEDLMKYIIDELDNSSELNIVQS